MNKEVTMKNIGDALGVSTVTVSKALAGKDGVSDEVREQIRNKAEEMGYRYTPSKTKKNRELRSRNIGVIVANNYVDMAAYSFYLHMYHSTVLALAAREYSAIMEIITPEMREKMVMPTVVAEQKVEGVIVLGQLPTEYLQLIAESHMPYVLLDFYDGKLDADAVVTDNEYGTYLLTEHCIQKGHTKIAYVGSLEATSSILDRYLGYYRAMLLHKLPVRSEYIIADRGENNLNYVELQLPEDMPTAFVCNCDEIGYLLINQLKKKGYRIPEDISVVGFDNYTLVTEPGVKMTTIEVDVKTMTEEAVSLVIDRISNGERKSIRKVISGNPIYTDSVKDI